MLGCTKLARSLSRQRAVRAEEAYGICKSQGRRTDGRVVGIRKVDSMNQVETSAMEEHVHGESRTIHAFDSRVPFEPVACGVALAGLIRNFRFAAIDGDKVPPHRIPSGSHSAHGT